MANKNEQKQPEVKFITSLAIAVNDIDGQLQHIQIVLSQDVDTKQWRLMFDVVDPTKLPKFAE